MGIRKLLSDSLIIFKIQILALRTAFIPYLIISIIIPVGFTYMISLASPEIEYPIGVNYLAGVLTLSLSLSIINGIGQSMAEDKHMGRLRIFMSYPISPISYIFGVTFTHIVGGLVNILVLLLVGILLWGIDISRPPLFAYITLVLFIQCISLIGIGSYIGTRSRSLTSSYMYTNIVSVLIALLTPAFYTPDRVPSLFRNITLLLPTTHASAILRILLLNIDRSGFGLDIGTHTIILVILAIIYLVVGLNGVKWSED